MVAGVGGGGTEVARFYALLGMDSTGLVRGAQEAHSALSTLSRGILGGIGLGTGLMAVQTGVRMVGDALSGSVNAVITYESHMAQVRKVVELTGPEFEGLSKNIRAMALELPVSRNNLADIAKVAGQLGIEGVADLTKFTEVAAKVSAVTELPVEQLSMDLGRLSTVMQRPIADVDKLASGIFGLASATASTENEILQFSLRIAGAAEVVHISNPFVLALSATLASLGVEAEAGGTAMQRAFLLINEAVIEGGDKLKLLGMVSGNTSAEFARLWRTDAQEAFTQFVGGLGKSGDAAGKVLEALGLDNQRSARAFLALSQNVDDLRKNMDTSNRTTADASRLNSAYGTIAATTASHIQVFKNNVTELSGSIGTGLVGAINAALPPLTALVQKMNELLTGGVRGSNGLPALDVTSSVSDLGDKSGGLLERLKRYMLAGMAGAADADALDANPFTPTRPGVHVKTRDELDMEAELGAMRGRTASTSTSTEETPEQAALRKFADSIGGPSGGGKKSAADIIQEKLTTDVVEAFVKGGDAQVAVVRAQHERLMKEWTVAEGHLTELGAKAPEQFFDTFHSTWMANEEDAFKAMDEAQKNFASIVKGNNDRLLEEQIKAYLEGGTKQVATVKSAQAELMTGWGKAAEVLRTMGVKIPETFFQMYLDIEAAKKAAAESARQAYGPALAASVATAMRGGGSFVTSRGPNGESIGAIVMPGEQYSNLGDITSINGDATVPGGPSLRPPTQVTIVDKTAGGIKIDGVQ